MAESLGPTEKDGEFKTAAPEIPQAVSLAFEKGSFFKDDVLLDQDAD